MHLVCSFYIRFWLLYWWLWWPGNQWSYSTMSGRLEKRRHRYIHSSLLAHFCWLDCKFLFSGSFVAAVAAGPFAESAYIQLNENCDRWAETSYLDDMAELVHLQLIYNDPQNSSHRWVRAYPNSIIAELLSIWQWLTDMDMALDTIVPESLPWEHTDEGPEYVLTLLTFYLSKRSLSR